jgi:hypothetical protein
MSVKRPPRWEAFFVGFDWGAYPLLRLWRLAVSLLQRVTFDKRSACRNEGIAPGRGGRSEAKAKQRQDQQIAACGSAYINRVVPQSPVGAGLPAKGSNAQRLS